MKNLELTMFGPKDCRRFIDVDRSCRTEHEMAIPGKIGGMADVGHREGVSEDTSVAGLQDDIIVPRVVFVAMGVDDCLNTTVEPELSHRLS